MSLKEELAQDLETTRRDFHHLLESVPESLYHHPSDNPAWTVGDVLYHITLGPPALRFEIWMLRRARGLYRLALNDQTSIVFNRVNALLARSGGHFTRRSLGRAYDKGHAGILSSLRRTREGDLQKSMVFPKAFVAELAGEVTVERLFRYAGEHFGIHSEQIRSVLEKNHEQTGTDRIYTKTGAPAKPIG